MICQFTGNYHITVPSRCCEHMCRFTITRYTFVHAAKLRWVIWTQFQRRANAVRGKGDNQMQKKEEQLGRYRDSLKGFQTVISRHNTHVDVHTCACTNWNLWSAVFTRWFRVTHIHAHTHMNAQYVCWCITYVWAPWQNSTYVEPACLWECAQHSKNCSWEHSSHLTTYTHAHAHQPTHQKPIPNLVIHAYQISSCTHTNIVKMVA